MGRGGGCYYTQRRLHRPRLENLPHCRLQALTTHLLSRTKGHNCTSQHSSQILQRSTTATGYKQTLQVQCAQKVKREGWIGREGSEKDLQKPLRTKPSQSPSHSFPPGWEGCPRPEGQQLPTSPAFLSLSGPPSSMQYNQDPSSSTRKWAQSSTAKPRDKHKYRLRKPFWRCRELGLYKPFSPSLQHPAHCRGTKQVLNNICWPGPYNPVSLWGQRTLSRLEAQSLHWTLIRLHSGLMRETQPYRRKDGTISSMDDWVDSTSKSSSHT